MGTLIGKGGANIRKLEEDFGVHVDFGRDDNIMSIKGPADAVRRAGAYLRDFIDENQEAEETIEAQRSAVLTSIVGKNAETIKGLQKEMGVAIRVILIETMRRGLHMTHCFSGRSTRRFRGEAAERRTNCVNYGHHPGCSLEDASCQKQTAGSAGALRPTNDNYSCS